MMASITPKISEDYLAANVCPICRKANQCAMELAKLTGKPVEPCWCVDVAFDQSLLDSVPDDAKGKACICFACASSARFDNKVRL
jgi:hypothetical protein